MASGGFQTILDSLADQYGKLDNQVERWAGHHQGLKLILHEVELALKSSFPEGSPPTAIFSQGQETYLKLLEDLATDGTEFETPAAYLNLRFFILLNAFLQACQESLDRAALNPSLDPAEQVKNSYYAPYFFERAALPGGEMIRMVEEEISQLQAAPQDSSGIMLAMRARKGIYATLAESYCPTHPKLYPLVQELDAIKASNNPGVIEVVTAKLQEILAALRAQKENQPGAIPYSGK